MADTTHTTASTVLTEGERGACRDARTLRSAFALFPSGVAAICGIVDSSPAGLVVSSFTSVSLDPPLVSVCIAHTSTTWPKLQLLDKLGISILASEHTSVAVDLASRAVDRFTRVDWTPTDEGAVFINGATLWIDAKVVDRVAAGDHDIIIFGVHAVRSNAMPNPLVFHRSRYHDLPSAG